MAVIGLEDLIVLLSGLVQLLGAVRGGDVVDDVERVLHAIVCDGGMALGQIPHGDGVDAQDVVRGGLVDVFLDAGLMRDLGQLGRAEVLVDIHEHGVHRVGCGLVEIDVSPVVVQRVRHACGDSRLGFEDLSGIAVEYGVEVHALLRRTEQAERLHGGARFERGLGGVVELLGQIILAAIYGSDRTRLLLHRDAAYFDAFRHAVRTGVAHLLDLVLHGLVQRGDDLIAAGLKVLGGERLGIHQLVLDGGEQVAVRPRHLVVLLHLDDLRERSFLLLVRCDVAVLVHDADHTLESSLGLRGVRVRIPYARSRNDAGEHGCLGKRQVLRILAVVRLGRRLNAVCIAAQVNGVHVVAQHLALVLRLRDFDGQERFPQLACVRRGLTQIIPFRVLLGDGGAALPAAGGQIVVQRACDADGVDTFVGIEGTVLRSHDRIADVVGQIGAADDFAVLLRVAADRRGAVVVIHGRLLGQGEFLRLRNFRGDVHIREQADARRDERREDAEYPFEYEMLVLPAFLGCAVRSVFWSVGLLAEHFAMYAVGGAYSRRRGRGIASARAS